MKHRGTETQRDPLTDRVIGCAIEVHRHLGPGLLESVYKACLAWELSEAGLAVERQMSLPIRYKRVDLDAGFRIDLLVNRSLVLKLKTVDRLLPVHEAQLMTYLRLGGYRTGLLLNFYTSVLKDGVNRMVM